MRHSAAGGAARLLPAIVLLAIAPVLAQVDRVDTFVRAEMQRQHIPGLSLAVIQHGKIVKAQGYGVADIRQKTPATAETVYKIGSVSKPLIAAGILRLVQEGRLSLADSIGTFLDDAPAAWSGITIRHLLAHTSGLVREAPGFDARRIQSDADVLRSAYALPLRFAPGDQWEYSNTGYFALAEVIRKVSGRPWSDYLRATIFGPAGMTSTRTTTKKEQIANHATGYSDNDELRVAADWAAVRPSGAFISTVLDLAKWDALLDTDTLLDASTRDLMWTPVILNDGTTRPYGLGWELHPFDGRRQVHHGGGISGFLSEFARFPDDRLTVIVLMNLDDADVESIAHGVAALYLRGGLALSDRSPARPPSEDAICSGMRPRSANPALPSAPSADRGGRHTPTVDG